MTVKPNYDEQQKHGEHHISRALDVLLLRRSTCFPGIHAPDNNAHGWDSPKWLIILIEITLKTNYFANNA